MAELVTISSSAFGEEPHVVGFRAREALGSPYEIELFLTVPIDDELDVAEAVGLQATLLYDRTGDLGFIRWSGVLIEVSIMAEVGQRSLVRAVIVPRLFRLSQTFHTRVFTGKSIKKIGAELLDKNGVRAGQGFDDAGLSGSYPDEEHVGQWQESDLDFLHRWYEREGIFYHFEQGEEAEKVLLVDKNPSGKPINARFHALAAGDATAGPCLTRFRADGRALPGIVKVTDRDYGAPALDLSKEGDVSELPGEVVLSHARLMRKADVDRISQMRTESARATAKVFRAEGTILGLHPGVLFKLEEHPRPAFNAEYLVIAADHVCWNELPTAEMRKLIDLEIPDGPSELYVVRLSAIDKKTPFRLQRRTPWPRVEGYETATVDGAIESDYAQIDDHGRYLIRFHADESLGEDAKVSTWVRMMQPHTGAPEGMHFPLRKGTEVIVAFLAGDPDRPVILGAVPNAVTPSVVTKNNHTQNRLFTGGGNQLEIEDLDGKQYVHWYTPFDHTHFHMGAPRKMQGKDAPPHETKASLGWSTDGCAVLSVGGSWDIGVGKTKHEIISGAVTEEYKTSRTETVTGPTVETYDGKHDLHVTGKQTYKIDTGKDDTIASGWTQKITGGWHQTEIAGGWTQDTITGGWTQTAIAGGWKQPSIGGGWLQSVTGGWTMKADKVTHIISGKHLESCGSYTFQSKGDAAMLFNTTLLQSVSTEYTVVCPKMLTLGAAWEQIDANLIETKGLKMEATAIKIEGVGASVCVMGVKMEFCGAKLENEGINLNGIAAKFETGGIKGVLKGIITLA